MAFLTASTAYIGSAVFSNSYGSFEVPVYSITGLSLPSDNKAITVTLYLPRTALSSGPSKFFPDGAPSAFDPKFVFNSNNVGIGWSDRADETDSNIISIWLNGGFSRVLNTEMSSPYRYVILKYDDDGLSGKCAFNSQYFASGNPGQYRFLFTKDSDTQSSFNLEDLSFTPVEPEKKPTKFYLSSPEFGYPMRKGESVEIVFTEEYSDGTVVTPAAFHVLNEEKPDKYGRTNWTLSGSTLTITEECWLNTVFLAVEPADNIVLIADVNITVLDPTPPPSSSNPYLPPDGGISGGGNQSDISTVTGKFDAQPGPSIVENLPNGSSGADIASSGMYTKYLCNNALLNLLAGFFWEDNVGIQALKAVLGNPIDSIISLTAYPFALDTLVPKTQTTIYFGQYDSHFSAFSLTKSSFQIDWGTVTIPFFWGSFLDYSPYTKIQLYLPWGVGFVSIDPNEVVPWSRKNTFNKADFVDGTIRVITNIELDKGACVHNIIGNNGRVIGSFGGIVGKQVPVTGSDNSARILAMINAAISSSAAIGTSAGGTLAAGKNLAYGKGMSMAERAEGREMIGNYKSYVGNTVQSLSNALSSPPSYPRAGTFSDATNTLGYQYPYLIISRPSQSVPLQYGRFMGYPSNIFHAHLGEVRGYTEVSSIHLDKIAATANELDELESILKGGVLL